MNHTKSIVIYGGNGFVGSAIAERLVGLGMQVICVSRTGSMPVHLAAVAWAKQVEWVRGDAAAPDSELLRHAASVISTVGAAPLPTFSKKAYDRTVYTNGTVNVNLINAAEKEGVNHFVLISAHVPWIMRRKAFAYYQGKICALSAIEKFSQLPDKKAVVIFPSAIYGTRYLKSGKALSIGKILSPLARLQRALPDSLQAYFPESMVSVDEVAKAISTEIVENSRHPALKHIDNLSIWQSVE